MQNRTQSSRWKYCVFLELETTKRNLMSWKGWVNITYMLSWLSPLANTCLGCNLASWSCLGSKSKLKQPINFSKLQSSESVRVVSWISRWFVVIWVSHQCAIWSVFFVVVGLFTAFYFPSCLSRINLMQIYMSSFNSKLKCSCCYLYMMVHHINVTYSNCPTHSLNIDMLVVVT